MEEWRNGDMRVVQRLHPLKNELGPGSGHEDLASLHGMDPWDGSGEQRKDSCCACAGRPEVGYLQLSRLSLVGLRDCGIVGLLHSR